MGRRLLTSLPIFGLSALAIGAPIPHDDVTESRVHNERPRQKILVLDNKAATLVVRQLGAGASVSRMSSNLMAVHILPAKHADTVQLGRASTLLGQPDAGREAVTRNAPLPPQAEPVTSIGKSSVSDIREPLGVTETAKIATTIQAQPAPYAAAPVTRTLIRPAPGAGGSLKIPVPTNRDPVMYGTSASNAYKVYFPQESATDVGRSTDFTLVESETATSDARVMQKKGSYLFYEDAAAPAEQARKPKELTAPALQKQPLDFGNNLFQRPVQPDKAVTSDPSRATAR